MERFVIVGAGTMGAGIAYIAAGAGYSAELVEPDPRQRDEAQRRLREQWRNAVSRGRLSQDAAASAQARLITATDLAEVAAGPAVLVEAVPERLELKRAVLAQAEGLRPALLASNTSSIPIGLLGAHLGAPQRFLGLHFFNPVWAMSLLEIVVGAATEATTVAAAIALAARLGKDPIVVNDSPGFATSRLGIALGLEAIRMLSDGVASAADIDKAMALGYRHPVGPLELTDLVGLDVRLDIARTLAAALGDRFDPPQLLVELVAQGRLGKKTGHGFYQWVDGARQAETT